MDDHDVTAELDNMIRQGGPQAQAPTHNKQFEAFKQFVGAVKRPKIDIEEVWSGLTEEYRALWLTNPANAKMLLPVYVPKLAPNEALVSKTRLRDTSSSQGTANTSKRFNVPCLWKDITSICPGFEAFKDHFYERLDACQITLNRKGLKFHKMFLVTVYLGLTED